MIKNISKIILDSGLNCSRATYDIVSLYLKIITLLWDFKMLCSNDVEQI